MPKKYEYYVVLTAPTTVWNKPLTIVLDHPINSSDIRDISGDTTFTVTNWKLLRVTGTFTYLFLIESSFRRNLIRTTFIQELDHKITASTIVADLHQVEKDFKYFKSYDEVMVLSYQEIPDE